MDEGNIIKVLENSISIFSLRQDGIVIQKIKEGSEIEKDDALELIETHKKLTPERSPMLILHTSNYSVSHDAQYIFAHDNFPTALAIITNSPVAKSTANLIFMFFDIIKKKHIPKKLFRDEKEALIWLKTFTVKKFN